MLKCLIRNNRKISLVFRQSVHTSVVHYREKAKVGYGSIEPILDFKRRFEHREHLKTNLQRRGQAAKFDVQDLYAQWKLYDPIASKIQMLESERWKAEKQLKAAKKTKQQNDIQKYGLQLKTIREDLRNLNENLAEFQENFIRRFLSLPNDLHEMTPDNAKVVFEHGKKSAAEKTIHHMNCADAIEYHNQTNYFLMGEAAKFEHVFTHHCLDYFRQQNFIEFSNPDFVQIPILDAIGAADGDFYTVCEDLSDPSKLIHLAGNSSLHSFMGFIARLRVHGTLLPLKWVTNGRIYKKTATESNSPSLYDVCQSSTVHIFQAGTEQQMLHEFQETIKVMCNLYEKLDIHFRVVYTPANELSNAQSLAAKIEMFSPAMQRYIEVGQLCYYSDYISKRLLFSYIKDREKNTVGLMHVVSGTVCNLTKLIAIILETHNGRVPSKLLQINDEK